MVKAVHYLRDNAKNKMKVVGKIEIEVSEYESGWLVNVHHSNVRLLTQHSSSWHFMKEYV